MDSYSRIGFLESSCKTLPPQKRKGIFNPDHGVGVLFLCMCPSDQNTTRSFRGCWKWFLQTSRHLCQDSIHSAPEETFTSTSGSLGVGKPVAWVARPRRWDWSVLRSGRSHTEPVWRYDWFAQNGPGKCLSNGVMSKKGPSRWLRNVHDLRGVALYIYFFFQPGRDLYGGTGSHPG